MASFEKGYAFDVPILTGDRLSHPQKLFLRERLERFAYLSGNMDRIVAKYAVGVKIFKVNNLRALLTQIICGFLKIIRFLRKLLFDMRSNVCYS